MTGYGPVIRRLRGERGWSARALAEKAGIGQDTLRSVESGWAQSPRLSTIEGLARAFDVTVADLQVLAGVQPPRGDMAVSTTYSIPIGLRDAVKVVAACHGVTPSAWVQEALRERLKGVER